MSGLIEAINTSVLGIFGEKDHIISFDDVIRFRNALESANLDYQVTVYAGAPHGWLNDTMPGRYRPRDRSANVGRGDRVSDRYARDRSRSVIDRLEVLRT